MASIKHSNVFKYNFFCWNIFGIWPGRTDVKNYGYYSFIFVIIMLYLYVFLLTINLFYTPFKLNILIREILFFFIEITVVVKVLMILYKRDKILELLDMLDCDEFNTVEGVNIKEKAHSQYKTSWIVYTICSNVCSLIPRIGGVIMNFIFKRKLELPVCSYYFLSDEIREKYFYFIYFYQMFGIYAHMMYNVSIDSFVVGVVFMAITQIRVLNSNLSNLKVEHEHSELALEEQEKMQISKLNQYLRHYDLILQFCSISQNIFGASIFVQFAMSSINNCVVLCEFLLDLPLELLVHKAIYFVMLSIEIFIPGWIGTQLSHESQELVRAAYGADWIPRSEPFKRSLRIFVERANIPVQLTGLNMFPLSIDTFTSIMKTAYSFFTLLRCVLDEDVGK